LTVVASKQASIGRIENVPLTEQARSAILEAIVDKRFDERLPSEEALADMLSVSRTTIRTALQSLEQEGIITRKRAIGTTINAHVRPSTMALQRMVGFDGLLKEKGYGSPSRSNGSAPRRPRTSSRPSRWIPTKTAC
jgi:GntR family transcriptional regulator